MPLAGRHAAGRAALRRRCSWSAPTNSEGTDLRPGRYTDLAALVDAEADEYDELQDRVADLDAEVDGLTEPVGRPGRQPLPAARSSDSRTRPGSTPRTGPGVTVTLSDAPEEVIDVDAPSDMNLLVVHQQDIQAVVNAMWKGGAEAVTIQGQRVISTTGIKCEGNAVLLQGVPYPQPYVIEAVGDPAALIRRIDGRRLPAGLPRAGGRSPTSRSGWDLAASRTQVTAPAYDGLLDLTYAEPLR